MATERDAQGRPRARLVKHLGRIRSDERRPLVVDRFWRQVDDALGSLGLSSEEQTRLEALVAIRFPRRDRHEVAASVRIKANSYTCTASPVYDSRFRPFYTASGGSAPLSPSSTTISPRTILVLLA